MRLAVALLLALAGCAAIAPAPSYRNPLLEGEFADPAVLRAPDGRFFAYATQGIRDGRMLNIQVARSDDLVHWEHLGDALPAKPRWGAAKQWFWAPHVLYDEAARTYFMYYSAEPDESSGKCLAVATSTRPEGPFGDSGAPLLCGSGIEHIDPMAFDDPQTGARLLYWGSGRAPILAQALAPDRLRFAPGSAPVELLRPRAGSAYRELIEAAWVVHRQGWYYLFYSGDRCCTREPRYAVMVARSRGALGPYEELEAPLLERGDAWLAPGHCAIAQDDDGEDWMLYHAIDARAPGNARLLLIDRLAYSQGWPRVEGAAPSASPRPAPRAGPSGLR